MLCLCCRSPGLSPDCVCLFFIFKIVFPPEGLTCIFLGLSEADFLLPLPHRVHRLRTQRHPLPPVPRPTRLLLPAHGHLRCPPLLRGSLRSSFPTSLQFPLIFYRAWIEKDKYGIYPGVLSSLSRSGCPELFTISAASPAALGTRSGVPHPSPLHPIKATLPAQLRARL